MSTIKQTTAGLAAALLASTGLAFAQMAEAPDEMPAQMTEDPVVAADTATHYAVLNADGAEGEHMGAAWFFVDPQNNTVNWTVEYEGLEPITAIIACGDDEDATVTLGEALDNPIEGETAIDQDAFNALVAGECEVILTEGDDDGIEIRGAIVGATMNAAG